MIIYTTVPPEQLWEGHDKMPPAPVEMVIEGKQLLVQTDSHQQGSIVRLISTEPEDFLDPRFQPGNKVIFQGTILLD